MATISQAAQPSSAPTPIWCDRELRSLSVLMPIYNESRTLRTIVRRLLESPIQTEVELVCVDDCSHDDSWSILQELASTDPRIRIFRQTRNAGKASALRRAIQEMKGDIAIVQDADLEYDPNDIPRVIAPILQGRADAVFGSRFASTTLRRVMAYKHRLGNKVLTTVSNWTNNLDLTDMETCYKAVRSDVLKSIPLKSARFGIEPELTTRLAQWQLRIYEVPISYYGRSYAEGKNIGWRDAVEAIWCLFKCRYWDTRFTTHDGHYLLENLRRARQVNSWTLDRCRPFVGKRVLKVGAGIGNFAEQLLDRQRLVCVDQEPLYVEMLRRRFAHLENVDAIVMNPSDNSAYEPFLDEQLDTVLAINAIERVENDQFVLQRFFDVLQPSGHAVVIVPAHERLFGPRDKALGRIRRYDPESLFTAMRQAGFEIVATGQYNRLGAVGWAIRNKLGWRSFSPSQLRLLKWLLPLTKLVDVVTRGPGLNLFAVGRKPSDTS